MKKAWTTPKQLHDQVTRLWKRGLVLQSLLSKEPLLPKRLILKVPSSEDLTHSFTEVRDWCDALSRMDTVRFIYREVHHRVTGTNILPAEAWLDSAKDAVKLLKKQNEWQQFNTIVKTTQRRRPELLSWIAEKTLAALQASEEWERYLDIIDWMLANPRPNCYLRQVDLPGIHSKFIESNRGVLSQLFDRVLPAETIETAFTGLKGFCRRYGFREKPERIRFRVLDPRLDPLHMKLEEDITLVADTLAALGQTPKNLFITENEMNFLAFPKVKDSWILFGSGYGGSSLRQIPWMNHCNIFYWGDIDTHGFAILDELRSIFPKARSFLMDPDTLLAHQNLWDIEPKPCTRRLSRLTEEEAILYADLQFNKYGKKLRLEQERISFSCLRNCLLALGFSINNQNSAN
jgi:hypothetical protein